MKELLFKQFEREIKETDKKVIDSLVEVINEAISEVNTSNLKLYVLDVKNIFDSLIMNYEDYKSSVSIRESLLLKYKDVDTFKKGLQEFKETLTGKIVNNTIKEKAANVIKPNSVEKPVQDTKAIEQTSQEVEVIKPNKEELEMINKIKNIVGDSLITKENAGTVLSGLINILPDDMISEMIEGMNEFIKSAKEIEIPEETIESKAAFTNTVVEGPVTQTVENTVPESNTEVVNNEETVVEQSKSLIENAILKCNQDAEIIAQQLQEANQIFNNIQIQNNQIEETIEEDVQEQQEEVVEEQNEEVTKELEKLSVDELVEGPNPAESFKIKNTCQYEGCKNKKHTSGYCAKHYKQLKSEGKL